VTVWQHNQEVVISDLTVDQGSSNNSGILNRDNLTLNNVTVTGAQDGITNSGELLVGAVLTINNSLLTGNSQSGLFVFGGLEPSTLGGEVTINYTTISDNDFAGILNLGPFEDFASGSNVVVNRSTITDNGFAGIFNGGPSAVSAVGNEVVVNKSTISGNGQGIVNEGADVAQAVGGIVEINNSTISNNNGDGIQTNGGTNGGTGGTTKVSSSTIAGNAFIGIINFGDDPDTEVKNSIVANNTINDCVALDGVFTPLGVNFNTDDTCPGFTQVTPLELNLGPLQNNGGPTDTQALIPPSAAIDIVVDCTFIDGSPVLEDQRCFLRPELNCDAGAFEFGAEPPPEVRNIPTLSEWGVLITFILLGLTAVYFYKRKRIIA